jgi:hypothetical protein
LVGQSPEAEDRDKWLRMEEHPNLQKMAVTPVEKDKSGRVYKLGCQWQVQQSIHGKEVSNW